MLTLDPDSQHWLKHSFLTDIRRVPARPGDPGRRRGSEPAGRPSSQRLGSPRTRALHSRWEYITGSVFVLLMVGLMPFLGVDTRYWLSVFQCLEIYLQQYGTVVSLW
jgi:hypothetical protein